MPGFRPPCRAISKARCNLVTLSLFLALAIPIHAQSAQLFPASESIQYGIDWRLIPAGNATVRLTQNPGNQNYSAEVRLESAGVLDKLFRVRDLYSSTYDGGLKFCAVQSVLDASEGKRRRETTLTLDRSKGKASSVERDLINNSKVVKSSEVATPACVQDVIGGLIVLRQLHLEPGQSSNVPITDGKKSVMAKVEAQEREELKTKAGAFKTIRYEAFVFDNVLYKRSARLQLWITDDPRRLVVQIRVKMQFTIGTVTLTAEKIGDQPMVEAAANSLRGKN